MSKAKFYAYMIRGLLWMILKTCRFKVHGGVHLKNSALQGSCMIMLWHNRLALLAPSILKSAPDFIFTSFVSNHRDGKIVAELTTSYPQGRTIDVSPKSKESALKTLIYRLKKTQEVVMITPDGPRGPRYVIKPGVVLAAKEAEVPIVPYTWKASSYWEIKSWDLFRIPKPFSTIDAFFGEPLRLDPKTEHAKDIALLQKSMELFT